MLGDEIDHRRTHGRDVGNTIADHDCPQLRRERHLVICTAIDQVSFGEALPGIDCALDLGEAARPVRLAVATLDVCREIGLQRSEHAHVLSRLELDPAGSLLGHAREFGAHDEFRAHQAGGGGDGADAGDGAQLAFDGAGVFGEQGEQGQAIQREQFNTTAALQQQQNLNQSNMGIYQEKMKEQAAERQARATESAGKK